ncbi:Protein of unknown function (DUF3572) [Hoeflea phototrophica DFL-43]|uniref:DUF3572 family protein n=1 Tax=Hoeflea phototrophica (strain DSM 17068 / NCIMB 14078 / DFL-43) TaxID=411684 RepID=A9D522_HOEPD|nr:DUF3572 domain-containing protein [Hoeflea phototrophica]EDQ34015.2 Protein of unknown function (DUF3572) [Hoeflea phototrophica DFL-43]
MADAEDTAIAVLVWLAGEPELMGRFLALTGLEANNLRDAAQEPGFLAGVLGFLMSHEPTLMDFCAATDTKPEIVTRAFQALGGASETQ